MYTLICCVKLILLIIVSQRSTMSAWKWSRCADELFRCCSDADVVMNVDHCSCELRVKETAAFCSGACGKIWRHHNVLTNNVLLLFEIVSYDRSMAVVCIICKALTGKPLRAVLRIILRIQSTTGSFVLFYYIYTVSKKWHWCCTL